MKFNRSENALEACEEHFKNVPDVDPQIEAILTSYTSAVIYAEFESIIKEIVSKRASRPGTDPYLVNFAKIASNRLVRSINQGDLAGVLAFFHTSCKESFNLNITDEASEAWRSIINNRHGIAHETEGSKSISNLTFDELKDYFETAKTVLRLMDDCLKLP